MHIKSTPSVWRATRLYRTAKTDILFISILAFHTEGDLPVPFVSQLFEISIHALHTEGDP